MAEAGGLSKEFEKNQRLEKARRLLAAEQLAARVVERHPTSSNFPDWQSPGLFRINVPGHVYGLVLKTGGKTFLLLQGGEDVADELSVVSGAFAGSDVGCELIDNLGKPLLRPASAKTKPFFEGSLGRYYKDLQVRLYFNDSDIFEKAASRQVTIYLWAGVLVVVLILAASGFAGRALGRQIRLNRLKNDFIATVTHELKTPLASMRVLADTLLEGNYKDQQQATEYLELICRENERLTGLIDNFLTFSRMERNKQAFEFEAVNPAEVAGAAVDAVKTKFDQVKCRFELVTGEDLPDVSADKDAMVTVLVNLL
ncbi:MAG: sensor histidine kinase, partial [Planctomycetota bacterium]